MISLRFRIDSHSSLSLCSLCFVFFNSISQFGFNFDAEIGKARNLCLRFTSLCPIMAVAENAGVKVESSSAADTKPACPDDDKSPNSDSSSLDSSDPPTPDSDGRTDEVPQKDQTQTTPNGESGGSLNKSEIKDLSDAFSKLNPMAKEFVPRTRSGGNGLGFTNNFADGSHHLATRVCMYICVLIHSLISV